MKILLEIIQIIKEFHIIPIEIFRRCLSRDDILGIIVSIIMFIVVIICDILILCCIYYINKKIIICIKTSSIKTEVVIGIVIKKEHYDSYYQCIVAGKAVVPVYHPERFSICVDYSGEELFFDIYNKDKFENLQIGDEINLILIKRFDKNGKVIEIEFELED